MAEKKFHNSVRKIVWGLGLLGPTLTLIPLGSLWLWQNGYLLHWAIVTALTVSAVSLLQWQFLKPVENSQPTAESLSDRQREGTDPGWTPAEVQAWADVSEIVTRTDATTIVSQDAALALAARTIRAVARRLHPEVGDPLWQFTVPEAFALIERVGRRLRVYVIENVPLGDRLTVAQLLAAYRWRGALNVAEKAYDVWRIVRLMNPVTAATHELRESLSRHILDKGRTHISETLMKVYVEEVGRAAIDLYGGRLRVTQIETKNVSTPASAEPLRILIVGSIVEDETLLLEALLAADDLPIVVAPDSGTKFDLDDRSYRPNAPRALLVRTQPLDGSAKALKRLVKTSLECDMVILGAHGTTSAAVDRDAILAIKQQFERTPTRRAIPIIVAVMDGKIENSQIADVATAVAVVRIGADTVIDSTRLAAAIVQTLIDAQRSHLLRVLHVDRSGIRPGKIWTQTVGAARAIGRSLGR